MGKYRNRRFKQKKGPLVIYNDNKESSRAFRNIPGVEFSNVNSLSILKLAPGGHMGRFCIWTKSAFEKLENIFGTFTTPSQNKLRGRLWSLPRTCMTNTDVERILMSDEVYNVLTKKPEPTLCKVKRGNLLKNTKLMNTVNPYLAQSSEVRDKKRNEIEKTLNT